MGKYNSGYARVPQEFYPTPDWVTEALADYVELKGRRVWEPACGDGRMAEALKRAGARVYASDIEDRGYAGLNERLDFTSLQSPKVALLDPRIITNPPYAYPGERSHRQAAHFVEAGLHHIDRRGRGLLALLLPVGFDSLPTRLYLFADCPDFAAKIVLTERIVWFERDDGKREDPKENHAWFLWQRPRSIEGPPILRYDTRQPKIRRENRGAAWAGVAINMSIARSAHGSGHQGERRRMTRGLEAPLAQAVPEWRAGYDKYSRTADE